MRRRPSLITALSCLLWAAGFPWPGSADTLFRLDDWEARIEPEALRIHGRLRGETEEILVTVSSAAPLSVRGLTSANGAVRWSIPPLDMQVTVSVVKNRLHVRFETSRDQDFTWPVTGADERVSALIYPDGEGLYIPLGDAFWRKQLAESPCYTAHGGLSMPFWSHHLGSRTITYLAVSDLRTEVCTSAANGRLSTRAIHSFRKRDGAVPYEIAIWVGGAAPVAPAVEFRQWLMERGQYVTLAEKIRRNPEVAKLLGAPHAYVYGDGRTTALLEELKAMAVDRMWLGYDQDARKDRHLADEKYIAAAKAQGYLVGHYDSFANIQDPRSADAPNAVWDLELYTSGCIIDERGRVKEGFGRRGCELSSEALEQAEPAKHYMERRVASHVRTGINTYFLDVDAYGELFDDYSTAHPMTPAKDRLNRLKRMQFIRDRGLVLGSEGGAAWSAPVTDFAHGAEAVFNSMLWKLLRDKNSYGGWWPPERPRVFFKPVKAGGGFGKTRYDPRYRVPLYQAAFHGSVIATDRWDTPLMKFPELVETRVLLELLYNVPSIWSLDVGELRHHRRRFQELYRFFSPIHRRSGDKPLSGFQWLTEDRTVQQATYGEEVSLTANFGDKSFRSLPSGCIEAVWIKENRKDRFCPGH